MKMERPWIYSTQNMYSTCYMPGSGSGAGSAPVNGETKRLLSRDGLSGDTCESGRHGRQGEAGRLRPKINRRLR